MGIAMLDLSDWAWVIIVGAWFLVKAVGRLFRSKGRSPKPATQAPAERAPERFGEDDDRLGDVAPAPIQPK